MAITGSQPARDELLRRKALSLEELRLANAQQLEIGMRSLVVICSVGRPSNIERSPEPGVDELWLYHKFPIPLITAKNHRVSIKNGLVVAVQ